MRDPLLEGVDAVVDLSDQGEGGRVRSCSRVAMWLIGMVCRDNLLLVAALFSTSGSLFRNCVLQFNVNP